MVRPSPDPPYRVAVSRLTCVKDLGLTFDHKLKFAFNDQAELFIAMLVGCDGHRRTTVHFIINNGKVCALDDCPINTGREGFK